MNPISTGVDAGVFLILPHPLNATQFLLCLHQNLLLTGLHWLNLVCCPSRALPSINSGFLTAMVDTRDNYSALASHAIPIQPELNEDIWLVPVPICPYPGTKNWFFPVEQPFIIKVKSAELFPDHGVKCFKLFSYGPTTMSRLIENANETVNLSNGPGRVRLRIVVGYISCSRASSGRFA